MKRILFFLLRNILAAEAATFERRLDAPQRSQEGLLKNLVQEMSKTEFGIAHRLDPEDGYRDFQRKIPISNYESLSPWIEKEKAFGKGILNSKQVQFYERTSGSSGPEKTIPYTNELKKSFTRMFRLWLYDVLKRGPKLSRGRLFMSVSPHLVSTTQTESGIQVGTEDDTDYLSGWLRKLIRYYLVVPPEAQRIQNPKQFKRVVVACLAAEKDLEVISIWNPSLFLIFLEEMEFKREQLLSDLRKGVIEVSGVTIQFPQANEERLRLFQKKTLDWQEIWPRLKLISCWDSAYSKAAALKLENKLNHVTLQGKGLLATEAPVTLPWFPAGQCVPLVDEVFYEFEDENGDIHRLHELEKKRSYQVIVSQKGGLCRYRLGDQVRVEGFYRRTPTLSFQGRKGAVCDLVGEKLNEDFVRSVLERAFNDFGTFDLFLPVLHGHRRPYYVWITDRTHLKVELDQLLQEAYHYRYARQIGQLDPLEVWKISDAQGIYLDFFQGQGMKLGNIKSKLLITDLEVSKSLLLEFSNSLSQPDKGPQSFFASEEGFLPDLLSE